jgi:hypothetical protein
LGFHIRVSKTKNQCSFSKCFFKLGFSDLGHNHNKNNASFRVEWGIGDLKPKWRRLMKRFDSTKKNTINFLGQHHY